MKSGKRIFLVILWGLILFTVLDWFAASSGLIWWQPVSCDQTLKFQAFLNAPGRFDVVFLGSSRMEIGLTPGIVEKVVEEETGRTVSCFNLSQPAGLVRTDRVIIRDLFQGERMPEIVVLGVEARGFNTMSRRTGEYVDYYARPRDILSELPDIVSAGFQSSATGALGRAPSSLLQYITHPPSDETCSNKVRFWEMTKGHGAPFRTMGRRGAGKPREHDTPKWQNLLRKRKSFVRENLLNDYRIGDSAKTALEEIFALTRERGIRLVVVNLPVTLDYMDFYEPGEYESYLEFVERACAAAGVPFIDFNPLGPSAKRIADRFFYDPDHLGPKGSNIFSGRLAQEVVAPLLMSE